MSISFLCKLISDVPLILATCFPPVKMLFLSICVCVCVCSVSQSCMTLCDLVDCSLPGSSLYGFPRQEYWSGLPFPTPGNLPDPGIEPWHLLHCRWILYHFTIWESLIYKWKISIGKSERYREEKGRLLGWCPWDSGSLAKLGVAGTGLAPWAASVSSALGLCPASPAGPGRWVCAGWASFPSPV